MILSFSVGTVLSDSTWGATLFLSSSYSRFGGYEATVESLMDSSLSINTNKVYKQGLQAFSKFSSDNFGPYLATSY